MGPACPAPRGARKPAPTDRPRKARQQTPCRRRRKRHSIGYYGHGSEPARFDGVRKRVGCNPVGTWTGWPAKKMARQAACRQRLRLRAVSTLLTKTRHHGTYCPQGRRKQGSIGPVSLGGRANPCLFCRLRQVAHPFRAQAGHSHCAPFAGRCRYLLAFRG